MVFITLPMIWYGLVVDICIHVICCIKLLPSKSLRKNYLITSKPFVYNLTFCEKNPFTMLLAIILKIRNECYTELIKNFNYLFIFSFVYFFYFWHNFQGIEPKRCTKDWICGTTSDRLCTITENSSRRIIQRMCTSSEWSSISFQFKNFRRNW